MEFGKLANVDHVDWSIPADSELSRRHLLGQKSNSPLRFYVGAPAWSSKDWVGVIYPPKTRASDCLHHYSRCFNAIELNTTHYRIPGAEQAAKWAQQVPEHFIFCPKIFQGISHRAQGLQDRELLGEWYNFLAALKNHAGPSFIQLPPHFGYQYKAQLFSFLKQWPAEFELALEFRHASWFQGRQILPALTEYLQSKHIGLVITDVAGRRDVLHTSISADYSLLRFIGNDLHPSDMSRIKAWSERINIWSEAGLKRMFLFLHEPTDKCVPALTRIAITELQKNCRADLAQPVFYELFGAGLG
jgi:uncharacterized protein YecE (DUF72 family)